MIQITQDQVVAMIRQFLPMLGTAMVAAGISADTASSLVNLLLIIAGPIVVVSSATWTFFANSRKSIMTSASRSVNGEPAPIIILDPSEKKIADALPSNVTTSNETRAVTK